MTQPMRKFHLTSLVTVPAYTTVWAETLEEAIRIGEDRDVEMVMYASDPEEVWCVNSSDGSTAQEVGEA